MAGQLMALEELLGFLVRIHPELPRLLALLSSLAGTLIGYKLLSRSLTRIGWRLEFDPHIQNTFRLLLRVAALFVGMTLALTVYQVPPTLFVGGTALVGAALGFGSSQTINNITAGFYVVASRPFRVKDYVMIGDVEGQVEEISINYTKLYTPSFNLILIPNVQVMGSRILNCTHEGFIKYTFSLSIPHSPNLSNEEIMVRCIEPAIEKFQGRHQEEQLRRPESFFESSAPFGRTFKFRIFVPKGEAKTLYLLQPELAGMIMNHWDEERKKSQASG